MIQWRGSGAERFYGFLSFSIAADDRNMMAFFVPILLQVAYRYFLMNLLLQLSQLLAFILEYIQWHKARRHEIYCCSQIYACCSRL